MTCFEHLLDDLDRLIVPPGYKPEIIRGNIVLSPWHPGYCALVMDSICKQLGPHRPAGHRVCDGPVLFVFPQDGRAFGPDIHVAPRRIFGTTGNHLNGAALSLAGELTSPSTRDDDYQDKSLVYGRAGVSVYLLLDMQEDRVTVFWSPSPQGYEARLSKPFGGQLHIPEPFDCTLDTTGFQRPASS
ncbi:Uma2 family endonuclease [Streptomyces sp. NPDC002550]